jgi:hypothetical protein
MSHAAINPKSARPQKRMRLQGKICLGIGAVCVLVVNIVLGAVLIVFPLLDYWIFTKDETRFVAKEEDVT